MYVCVCVYAHACVCVCVGGGVLKTHDLLPYFYKTMATQIDTTWRAFILYLRLRDYLLDASII